MEAKKIPFYFQETKKALETRCPLAVFEPVRQVGCGGNGGDGSEGFPCIDLALHCPGRGLPARVVVGGQGCSPERLVARVEQEAAS